MRKAVPLAGMAAAVLLAAPATLPACPVCDSATGKRVRAGIFNRHFGYRLAAAALPFPILLGITALIYYGPPVPPRRKPEQTHPR